MVQKSKLQLSVSLVTLLMLILSACAPAVTPAATLAATLAATPATGVPSATAQNATVPAASTPTLPQVITTTAPEPAGLAGTSWMLVSYGAPDAQIPVVSGEAKTTLTFGADGQASGSGGCNGYGGSYTIQGDTVTFGQMMSTLMACADENVNRQEGAFMKALSSAGKFAVAGDRLTIAYDNGQGLLTFTKGPLQESATEPVVTETVPTQTPASEGGGGAANAPYLDDRSTPTGLIMSYFNAINRREYRRAYAYWRDPAAAAGPFEKFEQGYQNTESVEVKLGTIGGDPGAGQMFYSVPALLTAKTSDGKTQTYAACYVLHLSQPGIQAEPPFIPLGMERGKARALAAGDNPDDALAKACGSADFPSGQPIIPTPQTNREDISKDNYLDDRSGPVEVLSSLFNAVNRKEYARAYGYWESPEAPFDAFQKGYAETESVAMTTGQVTGDAGAGQRYYSVPVVLKVQTTGGAAQTFAGCYTLHLANPQMQAALPFRPLAVQSAKVKQVENGADPAGLLAEGCKP